MRGLTDDFAQRHGSDQDQLSVRRQRELPVDVLVNLVEERNNRSVRHDG